MPKAIGLAICAAALSLGVPALAQGSSMAERHKSWLVSIDRLLGKCTGKGRAAASSAAVPIVDRITATLPDYIALDKLPPERREKLLPTMRAQSQAMEAQVRAFLGTFHSCDRSD